MALKRVLIVDDEQDLRIMVAANGEIPVAEACLKNGAMSYVPEPFNLVYVDHMAAVAVEQRRDARRQ